MLIRSCLERPDSSVGNAVVSRLAAQLSRMGSSSANDMIVTYLVVKKKLYKTMRYVHVYVKVFIWSPSILFHS